MRVGILQPPASYLICRPTPWRFAKVRVASSSPASRCQSLPHTGDLLWLRVGACPSVPLGECAFLEICHPSPENRRRRWDERDLVTSPGVA